MRQLESLKQVKMILSPAVEVHLKLYVCVYLAIYIVPLKSFSKVPIKLGPSYDMHCYITEIRRLETRIPNNSTSEIKTTIINWQTDWNEANQGRLVIGWVTI